MLEKTSSASESWEIHFRLTKLVASTTRRPVCDRRLMNSILVAVGTTAFSFCSPSRGPTSTIFTAFGKLLMDILVSSHRLAGRDRATGLRLGGLDGHQWRFRFHHVTFGAQKLLDGAGDARLDGVFHFHALEHHQCLADLDRIAILDVHGHHAPRHRAHGPGSGLGHGSRPWLERGG